MTNRHRINTSMVIVALAMGGCTTAPIHNDVIASIGTSVTVQGWTLWETRDINVQCREYFVGSSWTTVNPTIHPTGFDFTQGGETWYFYSGSVVIPESCWFHWHSQYTTELRFVDDDGYTYEVFDEDGLDCMYDRVFDGDAPSVAGTECGQDVHQIYIHAPD